MIFGKKITWLLKFNLNKLLKFDPQNIWYLFFKVPFGKTIILIIQKFAYRIKMHSTSLENVSFDVMWSKNLKKNDFSCEKKYSYHFTIHFCCQIKIKYYRKNLNIYFWHISCWRIQITTFCIKTQKKIKKRNKRLAWNLCIFTTFESRSKKLIIIKVHFDAKHAGIWGHTMLLIQHNEILENSCTRSLT